MLKAVDDKYVSAIVLRVWEVAEMRGKKTFENEKVLNLNSLHFLEENMCSITLKYWVKQRCTRLKLQGEGAEEGGRGGVAHIVAKNPWLLDKLSRRYLIWVIILSHLLTRFFRKFVLNLSPMYIYGVRTLN